MDQEGGDDTTHGAFDLVGALTEARRGFTHVMILAHCTLHTPSSPGEYVDSTRAGASKQNSANHTNFFIFLALGFSNAQ